MKFDIDKARKESETLEGAVADFRTACSDASVKLVEGSRISPEDAPWGLGGDLAEMRRVMGQVTTAHAFIAVERFDLQGVVQRMASARDGGSATTVAALGSALSDLKGLDGLAVRVRAVASFAGVPFDCVEEPKWRAEAAARITEANEAPLPKGPDKPGSTGNGVGIGKDAGAGGAAVPKSVAADPAAARQGDRRPQAMGSDTLVAAELEKSVALGTLGRGKVPAPKPRSRVFSFLRG